MTKGTTLLVSVLFACAQAPSAPRAPLQRGTVRIAHEVRSFRPCGEARDLWLIATPDLLDAARELGPTPDASIYVELRGDVGPAPATGFGAEYPAQLVAHELLRAAPANETRGCDEDLRGVAFRAAGNEPFWNVEVAAGRLHLRRLGHADVVRAVAPARASADGWSYQPPAGAKEADAFRLELTRGRCADSMVGTRTRWVATLELAGSRYQGCAWAGEASP